MLSIITGKLARLARMFDPMATDWTGKFCIMLIVMTANMVGSAEAAARAVRVGVYQNKPKIFMDENGKPAGLFIELLDKIARQEGWSIVYVPGEWEACLRALEDQQIDLMPDVAYSPERDKKYDFHKTPVILLWSRLYASPSTSIKEIADLDGKLVAVLKGSIQQTIFEQLMGGFGYKVMIVPTSSFEEAFALTRDGKANAAIANHLFGDYFYQKYGLVKTAIDFNRVELFYATAEGCNHDLLDAIERSLEKWIQEPRSPYFTVLGNWTEKARYHLPWYICWMIGAIVALLLIAAGMILLLRSQVQLRTKHLERSNDALRESYDITIEGWSRALDMRDKETEGHTQRVTEVTLKLARVVGMSDEELVHVWRGAMLHDIGKMGVPDKILLKPDQLTEEEWLIMRRHPQLAYDMLHPIAYLHLALDIPYCHHEKWDGTGYPRRLKGQEIPLAARLFAVVDVWDALMSDRPYRKAWSEETTLEYIRLQSGTHFDPQAIVLFFKLISQGKQAAG